MEAPLLAMGVEAEPFLLAGYGKSGWTYFMVVFFLS